MRAVKYGVTRDYVRGLTVVQADGAVLTVGGKNVKDASGLSLKNLFIGSEGTLCVITRCILRLIPKPETSLSLLLPYRDLKSGIRSVLTILRAGLNPTALEFMERSVVRWGERYSGVTYPCKGRFYILVTLDGHEGEVQENLRRIEALAEQSGAMDCMVLADAQRAADIWKVRGALVKAVEAISSRNRWISWCRSTKPRISSLS